MYVFLVNLIILLVILSHITMYYMYKCFMVGYYAFNDKHVQTPAKLKIEA